MQTLARVLPESLDVVWCYQLLHELCEIGADAYIWRARLLEELRHRLDAAMGVAYVMKISLDPSDPLPKTPLYIGLGENETWSRFMENPDLSGDPMTPEIMQRFGTDFTCARQELVDDEVWYASAHVKNVYHASGWDHTLYSQVGIHPPGLIDGIGIIRATGRPAFSPEDVAIVRLIHQELARLWRRPDPIGVDMLPARQREVLQGIRRGETRKEIAQRMDVSDHTVHSYEKSLFEKANVKSRGELLARLASQVRPALLP